MSQTGQTRQKPIFETPEGVRLADGRASWFGVTVGDLIADQLKPYDANHTSRIEGPEIVLNADATQALSMVIHELTRIEKDGGRYCAP